MSKWLRAWENGLGKRAYQPRLPDGRTLWRHGLQTFWDKGRPDHCHPYLLDDRELAETKARTHHIGELDHDWRPVSE